MARTKRIASLLGTTALAAGLLGCGAGDAQKHLRSAVDAKGKSLRACYESALERNRSTQGTMSLWVVVEQQSGKVTEVEVKDSDLDDPELETCVKDTLTSITLPKTPKAGMKVDYTLRFAHAGAGGEAPPAGGTEPGSAGEDESGAEGEGGAEAGFSFGVGGD